MAQGKSDHSKQDNKGIENNLTDAKAKQNKH